MIRLPNPFSNVIRARDVFRNVFVASFEAKGYPSYGLSHDDFSEIAMSGGHITSKGQIGKKALEASYREDRSRDAVFNQVKMMTELFRIFGWLMPFPGSRSTFLLTPLGMQVAAFTGQTFDTIRSQGREIKEINLFRWSLLNVCFPHPHTHANNGFKQRTFLFLLQVADAVGGYMTRDEMMLTALNTPNDRDKFALDTCVDKIISWRTGKSDIRSDIRHFTLVRSKTPEKPLKFTSMGNYTRFLISAIRQSGWFDERSYRTLPSDIQKAYQTEVGKKQASHVVVNMLTPLGQETLKDATSLADIRWDDLHSENETDLSWLALLLTASKANASVDDETISKLDKGASILRNFGISIHLVPGDPIPDIPVLFEPSQQLPSNILLQAMSFAKGEV